MTTKTPIKVIKRNARKQMEDDSKSPVAKKTTQEAARDMVATVSNWVSEFQQKRRTETKQAFNTLFPDPPRPSEV